MRKFALLLLLISAGVLAACNGTNAQDEPTARPTPTIEEETGPPVDGYPSQPTVPAVGYPSGEVQVWVIIPAGEQCADSLAYPTSDSAVSNLEAAGVNILAVEETELLVCDACGCPTSAHYRVLLAGDDIATAVSLGWKPEE